MSLLALLFSLLVDSKTDQFSSRKGRTLGASSAALELLDNIAKQFVTMNAPLCFTPATTAEMLDQVFRLRYEVVIAEGWATPQDFPDGRERDEYDDDALQLTAWDDSRLAATTRLVFPSADRRLPTEAAFDFSLDSRHKTVDVGRTIVAPAYRDSQHRLLVGMVGQTWIEARQRGMSEVCAILDKRIIRLYRRIGFEVTILAEPRLYWGEERFPIKFDLEKTAEALRHRTF